MAANFEEYSGSQCPPHIESSDSEMEVVGSESEISESDEDVDELDNANESEYTCFVAANGSKYWTPNCDDKYKPQTNTYIPTLEEAFTFYVDYGRICGFDVRKSTKKSDARGNLLAKYMLCNRGGNPKKKKSEETCVNVGEKQKKTRRTTSRRCNCKAQIILKPAGPRGFVLMSFVEEHNHPLASGAERMFLRCNRNMSIPYQNFIMDCARANIGPTRAHSLAKEQFGSFEDVGATVFDFKNFSRDIKVRIGDHDVDMILAKLKLKKETSKNTFYYDYKVDKNGHLTGLFGQMLLGKQTSMQC
ncbi:hypothetical protein POM88_038967 [Heracleum sosnowskyi]|uniref:FAR1 domain-containing protein n=1 Tax=Heracleum sosnowskyi TaxID=360622 RepID=A0AAD8M7E7_9APIA|nr:hypothetical protein POM88_038967 [Heracleum sosnowskyi]